MSNSFFQAICRVGIFMICAQAIIHFRPNGSYEKYLKLLVGVMVLMQLFVPLAGFLSGGGQGEGALALEDFVESFQEGMREAEKNSQKTDALLEKMTLEEVRRRAQEWKDNEAGRQEAGRQEADRQEADWEQDASDVSGADGGEERAADKEAAIRVEVEEIAPVRIGQEE